MKEAINLYYFKHFKLFEVRKSLKAQPPRRGHSSVPSRTSYAFMPRTREIYIYFANTALLHT